MILAFSAVIAIQAAAGVRELNQEEIPNDEPETIKEILDLVRLGYQQQAAALKEGKTDKVTRDAHGKHHGCLKAKFQVLKDLPAELRQGAFAYSDKEAPPSYKAWIRMS